MTPCFHFLHSPSFAFPMDQQWMCVSLPLCSLECVRTAMPAPTQAAPCPCNIALCVSVRSRVPTAGPVIPTMREGYTAALHGDSVYCFGGGGTVAASAEVLRFDVPSARWALEAPASPASAAPSPRRFHACATIDGGFVIHGGEWPGLLEPTCALL